MALDKETVRRIAHLARLKVPEEDLDGLAGELNNILSWVEQLDRLDTSSVEPMTSVVARDLPMRADQVTDGGYPERVLANAPDQVRGFFAVPKVVE